MPILQPHDTVHELGLSPLRDVHFSGIPLTLRVHFYGYSLVARKRRMSSMEKQKNFPGLLCPESLEDTAFDAMSSKLADNDGGATQT